MMESGLKHSSHWTVANFPSLLYSGPILLLRYLQGSNSHALIEMDTEIPNFVFKPNVGVPYFYSGLLVKFATLFLFLTGLALPRLPIGALYVSAFLRKMASVFRSEISSLADTN